MSWELKNSPSDTPVRGYRTSSWSDRYSFPVIKPAQIFIIRSPHARRQSDLTCLMSDFPKTKFVSAVKIPHPKIITATRTPSISTIISSQVQLFNRKPTLHSCWLRWHIISAPQQLYWTGSVDNDIIIKHHPVPALSNVIYPQVTRNEWNLPSGTEIHFSCSTQLVLI